MVTAKDIIEVLPKDIPNDGVYVTIGNKRCLNIKEVRYIDIGIELIVEETKE